MAASAPQLEQIIRDELRQPVAEIVRQVVVELVREQLNGHAPAPAETTAANGAAPSTKVCTLCGEAKPLAAFNASRRQCRKCRNARYPRNRRARGSATAPTVVMAGDEEPPRTGSVESGSEAQRLPD